MTASKCPSCRGFRRTQRRVFGSRRALSRLIRAGKAVAVNHGSPTGIKRLSSEDIRTMRIRVSRRWIATSYVRCLDPWHDDTPPRPCPWRCNRYPAIAHFDVEGDDMVACDAGCTNPDFDVTWQNPSMSGSNGVHWHRRSELPRRHPSSIQRRERALAKRARQSKEFR